MNTKIITFGCDFNQVIIISETDRLIKIADVPNFQVTIHFCDFVAVWSHAIIKDGDLIGDATFVDANVRDKKNSEVYKLLKDSGYDEFIDSVIFIDSDIIKKDFKVCEFLKKLGYTEVSDLLKSSLKYLPEKPEIPIIELD